MKKIRILLIIMFFIFLSSCDFMGPSNLNVSIKVQNEDQTLAVGDEIPLLIEATTSNYEISYDKSLIKIEKGVITCLSEGTCVVEVKHEGEVIKSFTLTIIQLIKEIHITNVPEYLVNNDLYQLKCDTEDVYFECEENDLLKIKESGFITVNNKGSGQVKVRCVLKSNPKVYDEVLIHVLTTNNVIIVKSGQTTDLIIGDYIYYYNKTCFNSLASALAKAQAANVISIIGPICENVTITKSNMTIKSTFDNSFDGVITLSKDVHNIYIGGINFTNNGQIVLVDGNYDIVIDNNTFKNTKTINTSWQESKEYYTGVIEFSEGSVYHNNIAITNNTFDIISDVCININNCHNIKLENNLFINFDKDGIRFNNGIIKVDSSWKIIDNQFINGKYNGLFFRTYASNNAGTDHLIQIMGNVFDNCGQTATTYSSCVTFRNYQEGLVEINVSFNTFMNSARYLFMRNNAVEANQKNYTAYVTYNNFLTKPTGYYFNNLNPNDTFTKNPKQAILSYNYYEEEIDNSLFIGCLMNSEHLSELVENVDSAFYNLRHNIKVGSEYVIPNGFIINELSGIEINNKLFKATNEGTFDLLFINGEGDKYFYTMKAIKEIELVVKFINIALGEIGYQELDANGNIGTSGNYTKYGAWYGINPGAWCAMYVSWCANQAGVPTTIIPKYASVSLGMEWYQNKGLFQYKENYIPKAGDIMFMKSDGASHTGIVLYCDGTTLYTVEGNTSDCCAMRKYNINNSKITGYGTPEWPYYNPNGYDFSDGRAQEGSSHSTT